MVKTEKYRESVMSITRFCKHINREIGIYQSHFLSKDLTFTVKLTNGTLKIPLSLAADFDKANVNLITEHLLKAASSFLSSHIESKSYKKTLADWRNLFLEKRKK